MQCPVCGGGCIEDAGTVTARIPSVFTRCRGCRMTVLDKSLPPPEDGYRQPCRCGKRFIDQVFSHLYGLLVREGIFSGREALREVGSPLLNPGYPITTPPFLPARSLVLLSRHIDERTARKMVEEVPEVRGVVRTGDFVPGVKGPGVPPRTYQLLAGCDVRANVFPTRNGPVVIYQQQSTIHIEFPRADNPKIRSVEDRIRVTRPDWFADVCCGAGTLGIAAARMGVPHVVLNDTWYAAAFWAACNLRVNHQFFGRPEVKVRFGYEELAAFPVREDPVLVAEAHGAQEIRVYQGDLRNLPAVIPDVPVLAAIDLFDKADRTMSAEVIREWTAKVNGEAFIP